MSSTSQERSRTTPRRGVTLAICAALVLTGAVALVLIFNTEPAAERETAVRQSAMLVDVTRPEQGAFRPVIQALGAVRGDAPPGGG